MTFEEYEKALVPENSLELLPNSDFYTLVDLFQKYPLSLLKDRELEKKFLRHNLEETYFRLYAECEMMICDKCGCNAPKVFMRTICVNDVLQYFCQFC